MNFVTGDITVGYKVTNLAETILYGVLMSVHTLPLGTSWKFLIRQADGTFIAKDSTEVKIFNIDYVLPSVN